MVCRYFQSMQKTSSYRLVKGDIQATAVRVKLGDHRIEPAWIETAATTYTGSVVESAEFATKMRQFLLPYEVIQTLDNPQQKDILASEIRVLVPTRL